MSYYIDMPVSVNSVHHYNIEEYDQKSESLNAIIFPVLTAIVIGGLIFLLTLISNIKAPISYAIVGVMVFIIFIISTFLFGAHESAVSKYFVFSDDRAFIIERIPEHNRQIVGVMSNTVDAKKITIEQADVILNSQGAVNGIYAYEIISAKSKLITPQGVAFSLKVKKSIYYKEIPEIRIESKLLNISNRYTDFKTLVSSLSKLKNATKLQ